MFRSLDAGVTWAEVTIAPPPSQGSLTVRNLVRGADGRLVAAGARGGRCPASIDAGEGYLITGICRRFQPALFVSDDDGQSWREIGVPSMAPPGDVSVELTGLVATEAGFVAAGTVRGPDWHGRLWSSPDGETWTLAREIRGQSGFTSVEQVLATDDSVVLLAVEHPCATPNDNTPGWILGTTWVRWLQVYAGTDVDDLTRLDSGSHPLVRDLDVDDCADVGSIEGTQEINRTTPAARGAVIGGVITLLEDLRPSADDIAADESDDDEAALTSGLRRLARLVDGAWSLVEIDGVRSATQADRAFLVDVDGRPGLFEWHSAGTALLAFVPIMPDGEEGWVQHEPEAPVVARTVNAAAWVDGALVVAGETMLDPFFSTIGSENPAVLVVYRSTETVGDPPPCVIEPGGLCRFADLSKVAGYPDFAGRDLTGIDLAFADLRDADLSGADLTAATLWQVTSGSNATLRGATLVGASAQRASIADVRDADLSFANLRNASFEDASGARLGGALLEQARLGITDFSDLEGIVLNGTRIDFLVPADRPYEVSLAGVDLTGLTITGARNGPLLKILDLTGATLDGLDLRRVDLTAVGPAVDFSGVKVWDDSICPDGLPPDDPPIGTCVRGD